MDDLKIECWDCHVAMAIGYSACARHPATPEAGAADRAMAAEAIAALAKEPAPLAAQLKVTADRAMAAEAIAALAKELAPLAAQFKIPRKR
jgi:hypothetical protein